jgi:hypothetical protein
MQFSESNPTHQMTSSIMNTGVIVHDATAEQKRPFWLRRFWADLMQYIMRGHEPRIWEKCNSTGKIYYRCYDPRTRRSTNCDSEAEVRVWLEQLRF